MRSKGISKNANKKQYMYNSSLIIYKIRKYYWSAYIYLYVSKEQKKNKTVISLFEVKAKSQKNIYGTLIKLNSIEKYLLLGKP